ncbi:MAG: NADH-quinone oxidoreductase subunit L [Gammaproteobacteria bacterium]|nr:NADH-quinone oxidoreductase subunit L [Gammaproteobacteria bacterium]
MSNIILAIPLASLAGGVIAGLFGKAIGRGGAHWAAILGVATSTVLSAVVFNHFVIGGAEPYNAVAYTWATSGGVSFEVGFLIDRLSATMLIVVSFVSLMVHIYTIGYMADDPGYQRFFSYIALFTFFMLMLVTANNFMQLFFGWEGVGLMSYLLIGFWYQRETAIHANMKAFLVNRVGDFGFLLGIGAVLAYFGTLDYATVFSNAERMQHVTIQIFPGVEWSLFSVICILLFIGAMGKSAQAPLHVWLPDSMEGPTPISALIHAATMVTAGIFMVARMSPLFELSETALSFVLVIGAITAFFMGLLGLVQNDIKRVVAYSTLSQLGYMAVGLGASAYAASIFHLGTHAFFKALLFLGAGSVIIALHHEQDMRKMGGLRKYMPITHWTALIGSLALIGAPGFSGFFSKDAIIEAVHHSDLPGSGFAYLAVLSGVFITALYSFRMYFLVFWTKERMDDHTREHLHETPAVVTVPLIMLAIPSVCVAWFVVGGVFDGTYFGDSIYVAKEHTGMAELGAGYHGILGFIGHGFLAAPVWLAAAGVFTAWYLYIKRPELPEQFASRLRLIHTILVEKYGFDRFNEFFFAGGTRGIGSLLWRFGDVKLIDGLMVNGSAKAVGWFSGVVRRVQSGYLYHYAFAMIIGLFLLLSWFVGV